MCTTLDEMSVTRRNGVRGSEITAPLILNLGERSDSFPGQFIYNNSKVVKNVVYRLQRPRWRIRHPEITLSFTCLLDSASNLSRFHLLKFNVGGRESSVS